MWIYRSFCDHRLFLLNPIAPFANPQAQSYAAPRTNETFGSLISPSISHQINLYILEFWNMHEEISRDFKGT